METKTVDNEILISAVRDFVAEGRSVELRCKGNSMNPFLVSGRDSVTVGPFTDADIVPGAVILGRDRSGRWLLHRVVKCCGSQVILNGDGNASWLFEIVDKGEIVAVARSFVIRGKRVETGSLRWRSCSYLWHLAGRIALGRWSLRRIILGLWRRLHLRDSRFRKTGVRHRRQADISDASTLRWK